MQIADFPVSIPLGEGKPGGLFGRIHGRPWGPVSKMVRSSRSFRSAGGARVAVSAVRRIDSCPRGPPPQPRITYPPIDDLLAGDTLTVEGRAAPGSTIRVGVEYSTTALGGQLPIHGHRARQRSDRGTVAAFGASTICR